MASSSKVALIGSGTVLGVNFASSITINLLGWTSAGVKAKTVAAAVHSSIGVVKAGSWFAYLQSVGALGQGILGASLLPYVVGGAAMGGGYYVYANYWNKKAQSVLLDKN